MGFVSLTRLSSASWWDLYLRPTQRESLPQPYSPSCRPSVSGRRIPSDSPISDLVGIYTWRCRVVFSLLSNVKSLFSSHRPMLNVFWLLFACTFGSGFVIYNILSIPKFHFWCNPVWRKANAFVIYCLGHLNILSTCLQCFHLVQLWI